MISPSQGKVPALDSHTPWVEACKELLAMQSDVTSLGLSWDNLAQQHVALYQELLAQKLGDQ